MYVSDTFDMHQYNKDDVFFDWDDFPTKGYAEYELNKSAVILSSEIGKKNTYKIR